MPLTAVVAESMMLWMSAASWPKPASFFLALSMARARSNPPLTAMPAIAVAPAWPMDPSAPTSCVAFSLTAPRAAPAPEPMRPSAEDALSFARSHAEPVASAARPTSEEAADDVSEHLALSASRDDCAPCMPASKPELSAVILAERV